MASDLDHEQLRALVRGVAVTVAHAGRHVDLPASFTRVGLPVPSGDGSKTERAERSVADVPDAALPEIARAMLAHGALDSRTRNALQDVLWAAEPAPEIPKRTRRGIARGIDLDIFRPAYAQFKDMLNRIWDLGGDPFDGWLSGQDNSLGGQIDRHVLRFPGDWTAEELFDQLGAFGASSRRFALFLEGLVSADALPDEDGQRSLVAVLNGQLSAVGLELRETGEADGYPVFRLTSTRAHGGRLKTLIFASPTKPDLRLSSMLDNEIEIVSGADALLVYDRQVPSDGLRWRDLQIWWKEAQGLETDEAAKNTLWRRLRGSLPDTSPPQRTLFDLFHEIYGERIHDLPALLPEVWMAWDPQTVKVRGARALLNLRMDFLMLMPGGHRVVIEVDGIHHYASGKLADPSRYAETMRGDRALKLARCDVYRFGAAELQGRPQTREMLAMFFDDLFRMYHVT